MSHTESLPATARADQRGLANVSDEAEDRGRGRIVTAVVAGVIGVLLALIVALIDQGDEELSAGDALTQRLGVAGVILAATALIVFMVLKGMGTRWRVVDIVVAAVLAVAAGVIFLIWNTVGGIWYESLKVVLPGLGGLATGVWFIGGTLVAFVIRKPGAAIFGEVVAACVSASLGSQWGITTIYSGVAQGLGVEIVLAIMLYKRWGLVPSMLAGAGAGVGAWVLEFFMGNVAKTPEYNMIYLVSLIISGAVFAGLVVWLLVRGLAATGALDAFPSGRARRVEV